MQTTYESAHHIPGKLTHNDQPQDISTKITRFKEKEKKILRTSNKTKYLVMEKILHCQQTFNTNTPCQRKISSIFKTSKERKVRKCIPQEILFL